MNIIIATPVLYEDGSPYNHLFKDLINGMIADGNNIIRIVAVENLNEDKYRFGIINDSISYIKIKRKRYPKSNIVFRYIADSITTIRMAKEILFAPNIDVLFEDLSYSSFWSILAARMRKIKIVTMIQDVWPDNAVKSGIIKQNSLLYRYFEIFQKYAYVNSNFLICISEDIKDFIVKKRVQRDKISVVHNWGYNDEKVNISWENNKFIQKYKFDRDKFYAVYAGNVGKMQNVEIVINIARELKNNDKIFFLIVGDGVKKDEMSGLIKKYELKNIAMIDMQPSELATSIYSMASINIIPLVKGGVQTALPSKTGICLSCGRPVLVCVDKSSKFAELIESTRSGIAVESDDYLYASRLIKNISDGIIDFDRDDVWVCFNKYFSREKNIEKYIKIIGACKHV